MDAAASDRRMPSLTVVVSSDTDICFSPGLYGLLADVATVGASDSFRAGACLFLFMLAHRTREGMRHIDAIGIVKLTRSGYDR
ncbi:hypothetical protein Sfulv_14510 [Streptomyces fulvorobeus]|uniref:Uncharacterized protein n=1 Tax=Streptomyces fulvorobeus TaxID=284028 RepID=A0A7J0C2B0_9ACTN|nr:hypothetical protein Sfulv_14510 [Streptomyces fulvorobeus]